MVLEEILNRASASINLLDLSLSNSGRAGMLVNGDLLT
jgi:hypothetical protein